MNFLITFLPLGYDDPCRIIVTRATSSYDALSTFARATQCFPVDVEDVRRIDDPPNAFARGTLDAEDAERYDAWGTLDARTDRYDPVSVSSIPVLIVRSIFPGRAT